jgi:hypothetical protein
MMQELEDSPPPKKNKDLNSFILEGARKPSALPNLDYCFGHIFYIL